MKLQKWLCFLALSSALSPLTLWAGGTLSALTQEGEPEGERARILSTVTADRESRHPILSPSERQAQAAAYVKTQEFQESRFGQLVQTNDPEKLQAYEKAHPLDKNLQAFYADQKGHLVQTSYAFMYQLSKNARLQYWEDFFDFRVERGPFSPPWEMGYCSDLHTLHLNGVSVPDLETGLNLKKLKQIQLTACHIQGPQFLKESTQIETYRLRFMLSETSPDLSPFQNLTVLEVSHNPNLTTFPDVREKHRLNDLYLFNTNIKEIPEWIGELKELRTLHLFRTPIRRLPPQLLGCTSLRNLWLPSNFPPLDGRFRVEQADAGLISTDSAIGWVTNLPSTLNYLEDSSKARAEEDNLRQEIQALRAEVATLKTLMLSQNH